MVNIFLKVFSLFIVIAEVRRPEGLPSGAPYSYRKEKETHELIFSWLSWPAALLVRAYAQRRGWQRHAALVYCVLLWHWTSMLWSIETCQNKVSAVSRVHIAGSSVQLIENQVFFEVDLADQVLVFDWIAGSSQVNLLKTGQDCSEAC